MFIEQRHQAILDKLNEKGSITTGEIQRMFMVGYDSAKRDLRILEEKGLLKRTHGGAIPARPVAAGRPPRQTIRDMVKVKENYLAIAQKAVSLIAENDVVYMPPASVGFLMSRNLPAGLSFRAVTNSVILAEELRENEKVSVIVTGGEMRPNGTCWDGFAVEQIKKLKFDIAFVTSAGISPKFGLSIQHSSAIPFYNNLIDNAKKTVGLFPTEKIGFDSVASICPADRLDILIADWDASEEDLSAFEEQGIEVQVVEKEQDEPEI